jgi:sec-independent protein translocase protein TatA
VGGSELLIVLAILLLFVGATRVPKLARSLGESRREFKKGMQEESSPEGPCPFCGAQVAEDNKFCPSCGRSAADIVSEKRNPASRSA